MPIFSAARVLSIRHDIRARSSVERFNGFVAKEIGLSDSVQLSLDAHRVLLKAVIAQQLVDTESGVPLSTHVEIGRLDKTARAQLKQAVKAVAGAIDLVSEGRV
jgi:signal-transduction protein with cAMP-binding, CBS, and nucleotidyltransferase domain